MKIGSKPFVICWLLTTIGSLILLIVIEVQLRFLCALHPIRSDLVDNLMTALRIEGIFTCFFSATGLWLATKAFRGRDVDKDFSIALRLVWEKVHLIGKESTHD